MKEQEKGNLKGWLEISPYKKILIVALTVYCIYQLGYGIGTFLAHVGF